MHDAGQRDGQHVTLVNTTMSIAGIPGEQFADVEKALDERTIGHNPERLSLMKGGIIYSNAITTVSPTYAQEALHAGAAGWLRSTLTLPDVKAKFYVRFSIAALAHGIVRITRIMLSIVLFCFTVSCIFMHYHAFLYMYCAFLYM